MAYRLRYSVSLDYIGAGMGPQTNSLGVLQGQQGSSGAAQTLELYNSLQNNVIAGAGTGNAISAADITTLTNNMAADIAAQLNLSGTLTRVQSWATSGAG